MDGGFVGRGEALVRAAVVGGGGGAGGGLCGIVIGGTVGVERGEKEASFGFVHGL